MKRTYLGAVFNPGERECIGPIYEIRKMRPYSEPFDSKVRVWGRDIGSMCASGYRVPVLFMPYADLGWKAVVKDVPTMIKTLFTDTYWFFEGRLVNGTRIVKTWLRGLVR